MNALSIKNLHYSISDVKVLAGLNLEIPANCYFAIAGVNGAGKSTLIKLVLDLIRPAIDSQIQVFEKPNQDVQNRERLAYLPEKFDVKKAVNGWQYLNFVTSIYGLQKDRDTILELSEKLDFPGGRLNSRVSSYSKGMVQKLGLISCFLLDREFLILDEPLSGLDPRARYHFKKMLLDDKTNARTILYSTHMLADAEEICDQFGILHNGAMKFVGTPQNCLQTYQAATLEEAYMKCISADN